MYGNYPNGSSLTIGYVQACINNTQSTLCNNALSNEDAQLICRSVGPSNTIGHSSALFGSKNDFRTPLTRNGFYDISCPSYSSQFNTYDCNSTSSSDSCASEGGAALISCVEGRKLLILSCVVLYYCIVSSERNRDMLQWPNTNNQLSEWKSQQRQLLQHSTVRGMCERHLPTSVQTEHSRRGISCAV